MSYISRQRQNLTNPILPPHQVLLPTSHSDHFSFPLSVLQSVAKIGNSSAFSEASNILLVHHRQGALRGRGPRRRPSRWTRDCVISAACPAPRGDFHNRAVGSASSHLLRSVNKSRSRLHFARLPSGAPQTPARTLRGSGPPRCGASGTRRWWWWVTKILPTTSRLHIGPPAPGNGHNYVQPEHL